MTKDFSDFSPCEGEHERRSGDDGGRGHRRRHGRGYGRLYDDVRSESGQAEADWPAFGLWPGGAIPVVTFGSGSRRRRRTHGGGRGYRGRRGDVRAAILVLLTEGPMHGYEMIQQIAERSQELWRPSPGSVYPTLQLLTDEGLIAEAGSEGTKKIFELTEEGRAAAEQISTPPWAEIADGVDVSHLTLRKAVEQLGDAVGQAARAASADQQRRVVEVVEKARRAVYNILAEAE